jgi:hypothetical protein
VPRYVTGPVEIRQGAFWQAERPLFFVGVGHFGQVRRDVPILSDYGFNIAQITISVGSVLPGENEVNMAPIDELVSVLRRTSVVRRRAGQHQQSRQGTFTTRRGKRVSAWIRQSVRMKTAGSSRWGRIR